MIWFILLFLFACGFFALGAFGIQNEGYVLISVAGWTWEMNLMGFILVILLGYLLLKLLQKIILAVLNSGKTYKNWRLNKKQQYYTQNLQFALKALFDEKWAQAQKLSLKDIKHNPDPTSHYRVAAQASKQLGEMDLSAQYALKAESQGTEQQKQMAMVNSLVNENKLDKAIEKTAALHAQSPKNKDVITLLAQLYYANKQFDLLQTLLSGLKKYGGLQAAQFAEYVVASYRPAFTKAGEQQQADQVEQLYKQAKKWIKSNDQIDLCYLNAMLAAGASDKVEDYLIKLLKSNRSESLVELVRKLELKQPNKLIVWLEKSLKNQPDDQILLSLLAICAVKNYDWGLAQTALTTSLRASPNADNYALLGHVYEQQNSTEQSQKAYKKGLALKL